MTLEEALINLVKEYGEAYIANPNIVMRLSRKRVFSHNPELKEIYNSLINVGYAGKLLELVGIEDCEEQFNELANNFYQRLGYSWEGVSEVFDAISSAIGLTAGEDEEDEEDEELESEDDSEEEETRNIEYKSDNKGNNITSQIPIDSASTTKLHETIKMVIDTYGNNIILDSRFINILLDYKAFDEFPSAKYILKAIIADGYANKIMSAGKWNSKTMALCHQFISTTGFQYDLTAMIFQSLAYGLGLKESITVPSQKEKPSKVSSQNHLTIKGIPIDGKIESFIQKLIKQGGELSFPINEEILLAQMEVPFMRVGKCLFSIDFSYISHTVYRVMVDFPDVASWWALENRYNECKSVLSKKYGSPSYCSETFSVDCKDDKSKLKAAEKGQIDYSSEFETEQGIIELDILNASVSLLYTDNSNYVLKKIEDNETAYNDL